MIVTQKIFQKIAYNCNIIFLKNNYVFSLHQLIYFIILCIKVLKYNY